MKRMHACFTVLCALAVPSTVWAQYPMGQDDRDYGRYDDRSLSVPMRASPVITRVELSGPLPPPDFQKLFALSDAQLVEYSTVYDSFTVTTNEPRTAALHRVDQLGKAVGRDSAAVEYYKQRLRELGKTLRSAQSRFDDRMKKLLTRDQQQQYRDWRKREDNAAKAEPLTGRRGLGRVPP